MTLDSLAWHFGNQNDEGDLRETLNGLRELELNKVADKRNDVIWADCEKVRKFGLLEAWPVYARKYPGRCTTLGECK
jgi:hypothetical protein